MNYFSYAVQKTGKNDHLRVRVLRIETYVKKGQEKPTSSYVGSFNIYFVPFRIKQKKLFRSIIHKEKKEVQKLMYLITLAHRLYGADTECFINEIKRLPQVLRQLGDADTNKEMKEYYLSQHKDLLLSGQISLTGAS